MSQARQRQWLRQLLPTCGLVAVVLATTFDAAWARRPIEALQEVRRGELPAEVRVTEQRVRSGGPFPFSKDGTAFGNRERLLPLSRRGYYREYTVVTPGARDRGARRLVCGGAEPTLPDACFYTDDHYASFRRLAP